MDSIVLYILFILNGTEKREATQEEEQELEQKYNKALENTINFNGVDFVMAENGDYVNNLCMY